LLIGQPAGAITGSASVALNQGRHAVMITGSAGTFCTGTAITRDLVLTAAHCVQPRANYKLIEFNTARQPMLLDIQQIARHPNFNLQTLLGHHATADIALLKLTKPLPSDIQPATIDRSEHKPLAGNQYTVTGYGLAVRGDGKTGGVLRTAQLVATGKPGNLQIRLVDAAVGGDAPGMGACTGDSGAAVYAGTTIVGVVSWSTGPKMSAGCGGLTGVTPLTLYRGWIIETARKLGSPLAP
jgi:secreted trypsin-like serine protease